MFELFYVFEYKGEKFEMGDKEFCVFCEKEEVDVKVNL